MEANNKQPENNEKKNLLDSETTSIRTKIKGILVTLLMVALACISSTCVPLLKRRIPDFELNSMRLGSTFVAFLIVLILKKDFPFVQKSDILKMLSFCITRVFNTTSRYVAVSLIPLTYYKSLYMTMNIITGLVLFPIFLEEKLNIKKALFAVLCVCGMILSIQPDFIFTWKKHHDINSTSDTNNVDSGSAYEVTQGMTILGFVLAASVGLTTPIYVIILKKAPKLTEKVFTAPFWTVTFGTVASITLMLIFENPVLPQNWKEFGLIFAHCMTSVVSWPLLVIATKCISGNTFVLIFSTLVIIMLIPQYTVLSHIMPGNNNWIEVVGTVLVFLGASLGSILELIKG